jgi:hypothetical protein
MTINQKSCHAKMVGAGIDFYDSFDQSFFNQKEEITINDEECYIKIFWYRMDFYHPLYIMFGGKYRWCSWHKRFHS